MKFFESRSNKQPDKGPLLIEEYLKREGIFEDAIRASDHKDNPLEEFIERHDLYEDTLRTDEGRKGAELKHRLTARMIILFALIAPMIMIPFWLMWVLSPANSKEYSERMQGAFLTALASNALGLCWVVTRDLFPQSRKQPFNNEDELEDDT